MKRLSLDVGLTFLTSSILHQTSNTMRSIKFKFTLFLTATVFVVVVLFSTAIYFVNVVSNRDPIPPHEIERMGQRNPRLGNLIERENNIEEVTELSETLRREEREKFRNTMFLLIPPTLLVSALISYLVSSYLVKPVEDVAFMINQYDMNKIHLRIPENESSEEIESLVSSFNLMLDRLQNSYNIQENFISDAAHELRTPLAAMKTSIQVFRKGKKHSKEDYENLLDTIENINSKLINLGENLLTLHRKSLNPANISKFDLNSLIEEILESMEIIIKRKNIKIETQFGDIQKIEFDKEDFIKVMRNLVENAVKYSNKGGEIIIRTKETKNKLQIEVEDQGIGIPDGEEEKVFDRFYRASNSTEEEGDGLGLSIVKKIIENYKGIIRAESGENGGTRMVIELSNLR